MACNFLRHLKIEWRAALSIRLRASVCRYAELERIIRASVNKHRVQASRRSNFGIWHTAMMSARFGFFVQVRRKQSRTEFVHAYSSD
jgi:hypothetical protein